MISSTQSTAVLTFAMLAMALLLPSNKIVSAISPTPTFEVDFGDPDSVDQNVKEITADILTGPEGVSALRIDSCGKHAILPVDINPSVMPEVTMVLGINLVSIAEGSLGWPLSSDNGGYDRSIIMHDERFFGMGMASGSSEQVWESPDQGEAPLNEWTHIVAVYSQPVDSVSSYGVFYVNGEAAPIQLQVNNGESTTDLVVGTNFFLECLHWTDSWIKEVKIFDSALTSTEVETLYEVFQADIANGGGGDDRDESNFFEGILDSITGGESDDEDSSDVSGDEPGFLGGLLDSIPSSSGSFTKTEIATNGLTMIPLLGTLLGFVW